ncbi:MAG: bifunctional UDP-sugar hydrolase/5'-nucleotidase [Cellulosilyticaceae bacterium]
MKRKIRFLLMMMIGVLICLGSLMGEEARGGLSQTILFTHDMHDHFLPIVEFDAGSTKKTGGYTRLKHAIDLEKNKEKEAILLDGGDFSMGTLFQAIYKTESPGLRIMGTMGYDATTLGNHEFDFRAEGLANSLQAALKSKEILPTIVQANTVFPVDKAGNMATDITKLKAAMNDYGVKPYTIINRNNLKIGVFGLMGKEAASNAPMSGVTFLDPIKTAKEIVKTLREEEQVDMVICLSHSGTAKNPKKSEDEQLAKQVPEIDVIISGHTHSVLQTPTIVGNTMVVSAGEYTDNLGVLKVIQTPEGRWRVAEYSLKPLDENIQEDPKIVAIIDEYKKKIQTEYLDRFELGFDQVVANTSFNFVGADEIGAKHIEEPLGNLMSDAYRYAVQQAEGAAYDPVAVAIVPSGTIRGSFTKGPITVSDAFTSSSLGVGADGISGYPLISAYLTGKELKTVCEIDASIAPIMTSAQLYMSGINFSFNPNRMIFNKVTSVALENEAGTPEIIDDNKLYRIVAGLYSAQMLSVVGDQSLGILSVVPKTKDGQPITDFEAHIIKDKTGTEVKEWLAIARYFQSFEKVDNVPQVPLRYSKVEGRKIIENDTSLWAKFRNLNKVTIIIFALLLLLVGILVAIPLLIFKKRNHKTN